jgi:hypothetical protein
MELYDLEPAGTALHRAAERGLEEELGISTIEPRNTFVLALILEWPILNPAAVVLARLDRSSEDLFRIWEESVRGDEEEAQSLVFIDRNLDSLAPFILGLANPNREPPGIWKWHPTSRYRLLAFARYTFGAHATLSALGRARQRLTSRGRAGPPATP